MACTSVSTRGNKHRTKRRAERREALTDEQITAALTTTKGKVPEAADILGVSRAYLSDRMTMAHRAIRLQWYEDLTDTAEDKLAELVRQGDKIACLFWLKCHGKKRGWIEKQEHQVLGAVVHQVRLSEEGKAERITALLTQLAIGSVGGDGRGEHVDTSDPDGEAT